jgi:hypothetical protein
MRESARRVVGSIAFGLLAAGAVWVCQIREDPEVLRGEELDRQARASLRRLEQKHVIVRRLADGRLSLGAAAWLFRGLYADDPEAARRVWDRFPDCPADELYCREVIRYVRAYLPGMSDRAAEVASRLEGELRAYREHKFPPGPAHE